MTAPLNKPLAAPIKTAGLVLLVVFALILLLVYRQFRDDFSPRTQLTVLANRSGLAMNPGSKVTYNGVPIGRVADISEVTSDDQPKARLTLDVDPKYLTLIPAHLNGKIQATTIFGPKFVSFSSPTKSDAKRISSSEVIDVSSVTTEFNSLFETVSALTEKVDPVKLNLTLSALAEALNGQGAKFAQSVRDANDVLAELNPQFPQFGRDIARFADVADIYTAAAPDLVPFFDNLATTGRQPGAPSTRSGVISMPR